MASIQWFWVISTTTRISNRELNEAIFIQEFMSLFKLSELLFLIEYNMVSDDLYYID
jgi:hypothetical protein